MGVKFLRGVYIGLTALVLTCTGCANYFDSPFRPPSGGFLTAYTIPLTIPSETILVKDLKKSSVKSTYFCWPYPTVDVAWSDYNRALGEIAAQGSISKLEYADLEVFTCLGVFGTYTVNVYGPAAE